MALNGLYCADVPLSNYSLTFCDEWRQTSVDVILCCCCWKSLFCTHRL